MPNIVVTGGAGFLGTHLCKRLFYDRRENIHVYCIDNFITGKKSNIETLFENDNFHLIEYDITNSLVDLITVGELPKQIHEIYHLACIASPPIYKKYSFETLDTNFIGTRNVLQLAHKCEAKMLFTSTSEVYGDPTVHPQPESYYGNVNPMGERSCYDEGKRIAETLIYEYRKRYNIDTKVVRVFNTYGPFMDIDDGRVITNFIKQIIRNDPLIIYGNGNQGRSFCYVTDMINGLISMMKSSEHGPINLGNPHCEFTLNELVKEYEQVLGKKLGVEHLKATENDPQQRKPVIDKALEKLNWQPYVSLKYGLIDTMKHFGIQTQHEIETLNK